MGQLVLYSCFCYVYQTEHLGYTVPVIAGIWYSNTWLTGYLPMLSPGVFDRFGQSYNASAIMTNNQFDQTASFPPSISRFRTHSLPLPCSCTKRIPQHTSARVPLSVNSFLNISAEFADLLNILRFLMRRVFTVTDRSDVY